MTVNTLTTLPTATDAAIAELKHVLKSFGHTNINVFQKNDMLYVEFLEKPTLSEELLKKIKNIFYWTDSIKVPYIDGLVHFYEFSDSLLISLKFYEQIVAVRDFIISHGMQLMEFDICDAEFSFRYSWASRNCFNYEELQEVRKIVDPSEERSRSVVVYGANRIHSMSVRP